MDSIIFITLAINFAPALLYKFSRAKNACEVKNILPFLVLLVLASIYEFVFTYTLGLDTTFWFWVYPLLEFACLIYFFSRLFQGQYRNIFRFFILIFGICFTMFSVLWIITRRAMPDSYLVVIETILVYKASVLWFKDMFSNLLVKSLWDSPVFYFMAGFILYFSGNLFLFLMADFIFTSEETRRFWIINIILSLFLNFILLIGIWKGQQKSIQYSG